MDNWGTSEDIFDIVESETVDVDFNTSQHCASTSRKRRNNKAQTLAMKKKLSKLVEKEALIWDTSHKLHCHSGAVAAAWKRIAMQMDEDVLGCKAMWKSMKDALRYRAKKKIGTSGDSGGELKETEDDLEWELSECLEFLKPVSTNYPRRTTILGVGSSGANEDSVDEASTESTYAYAKKKKVYKDESLSNSIESISSSISKLVHTEKSTLQYFYIWQNLDKLLGKLSEDDVDELNMKFINMAYEKIKERNK